MQPCPGTPMTYEMQAFAGRRICQPTMPSGSPLIGRGTRSSAHAAVPPSRLTTLRPSSASTSSNRSLPLPWAQITTVPSGISWAMRSDSSTATQMGTFFMGTGLVPSTCHWAKSSWLRTSRMKGTVPWSIPSNNCVGVMEPAMVPPEQVRAGHARSTICADANVSSAPWEGIGRTFSNVLPGPLPARSVWGRSSPPREYP